MNIPVDIKIDFLWGDEHFVKQEWAPITYVVGANGTGKSIFAEKLKEKFKGAGLKVRYFGADRILNLGNKWDDSIGQFAADKMSKGFDADKFNQYKQKADKLGQSIDAVIELNEKLDVQVKVESVLNDVFNKQLNFVEKSGFLNLSITNSHTNGTYDLKKGESHGLKEIITLLSFLYNDEYNCIILDEPELNLHPQFQQYIMQEIKKCAGEPDKGKKIFVVITHSPYMLDIKNTNDLLNYIVFHKDAKPSYIEKYDLDDYQMGRLNKLLMRINTNHKTLFFASSPVFVEGYIDQQIFNLIESKRDIPLGAEGVSIIDVGGKDEIDIMYSLCRMLGINAKAIADLDTVFEGRLRQRVSEFSESTEYLATQGQSNLMTTIGQLQKLTDDVVKMVENVDISCLTNPSKELEDAISVLKKIKGDNERNAKRRVMFLALQRIPNEIAEIVEDDCKTIITQIASLFVYVLNCFEQSNVYILKKGEIENYYLTYTENQYSISDGSKTDYFMREYDEVTGMNNEQLDVNYSSIIKILDKICPVTKIDVKGMVSIKLSDCIHNIQCLFRENKAITVENIKSHPRTNWKLYERVIDIVEFITDGKNNAFKCKFKVNKGLIDEDDIIYEFDQNTVPSQFKIQ